jgi:hypothetical protein
MVGVLTPLYCNSPGPPGSEKIQPCRHSATGQPPVRRISVVAARLAPASKGSAPTGNPYLASGGSHGGSRVDRSKDEVVVVGTEDEDPRRGDLRPHSTRYLDARYLWQAQAQEKNIWFQKVRQFQRMLTIRSLPDDLDRKVTRQDLASTLAYLRVGVGARDHE